jgi:hypothetical protein
MQQTKNTPEIVIPASPIETDLTCVDCTYNLRGLLHDGSCPECGASIERSVHGDQLVHANPIWLKKVSNGMKWIITALFLAHLPLLTIFTPESLDAKAAFVAVLANQCIAGALLCFGTFMFTAREPRLAHNEDPVNLRKTVRLFSIITGVAFLERYYLPIHKSCHAIPICRHGSELSWSPAGSARRFCFSQALHTWAHLQNASPISRWLNQRASSCGFRRSASQSFSLQPS